MNARAGVLIVALVAATACVDSKSSTSDTSRTSTRQDSATRVDMIQLDTAGTGSTQQNQPSVNPGRTTGESRRDAETRQSENRDPMPPLAGETNTRHGTMRPAEPVLRDSASGPRMRIDSTGKVTPIKR